MSSRSFPESRAVVSEFDSSPGVWEDLGAGCTSERRSASGMALSFRGCWDGERELEAEDEGIFAVLNSPDAGDANLVGVRFDKRADAGTKYISVASQRNGGEVPTILAGCLGTAEAAANAFR